ncbi:ATP-dependent RNA helicase [Leucobacter sp. GX24907]
MHHFDLDRIGAGLPVAAARAELEHAAASGALVVTAPPGTGKSTFVPPLIANLSNARVLVTQPRRVAVRAVANRISTLDGSVPGEAVGFTVRGERKVSSATRIEALTPGVLLRRLLADPELDGVDAVILDEVHERSLEGDLLIGMLAEARQLREDLLVVAMSATLDAEAIAGVLGHEEHDGNMHRGNTHRGGAHSGVSHHGKAPAPIVAVPAALHSLEIEYAPFDDPRIDARGVARPYLAHLAEVASRAHAEAQGVDAGCDALVFVPGAREVDETVRLLRARIAQSVEVLPLHGRLTPREQDRAVRGRRPGDPSRIVVSTALAESSLTVPGVRLVIDAGLAREVRRDRGRDMTGLVTVSASRASCEQRAGRAARQGPGRAVRVFSEAEFARMQAHAPPEIASADLVDAAMLLAEWGTSAGEGLPLLTAPPAGAMRSAVEVLHSLELVDENGRPTRLGSKVAKLPVGAREARALLSSAREVGPQLAAEVIAAISDDHRHPSADLGILLRELRSGRAPGAGRWKQEARRLTRIASDTDDSGAGITDAVTTDAAYRAPGITVALTRPEWIARRTDKNSRSYLLASGTRAALPEGSTLIGGEWIAVHEVQRAEGRTADGTGAVIRLAAALSEEAALRIGDPLITASRQARIDDGRIRVREERRLGTILLASQPAQPTHDDTAHAFAAHLRTHGARALHWSDAASTLRSRLALLHRELGDPWPEVDDAALIAGLDTWLGPDLARLAPDASLSRIDVAAALRALLPWPEAARLDELVPERLSVPSGSTARIDYPDAAAPLASDARPIVAVNLQELFGLAETPRLVEGRVPVLFHLLSPARRPLAVTDDLSSFWNGPYAQVRREMRGRYPKHPWPEDPWSAEATARTRHTTR